MRHLWLPTDADSTNWLFLGLSGFFGFFIADLCMFRALLLIGPRLALLVQSLTPPITALGSWLFLHDPLAAGDWLGMAITVAGVSWVILGRTPPTTTTVTDPHYLRKGLLLAAAAALAQAIGFIFSKQGIGDYDAVAGTFIRVLAAIVGFSILISATRRWQTIVMAARNLSAMSITVLGSIVGPFLGVALSLVAIRHCHAGVAATIISTTPVLILPFVIVMYHEKVSLRAACGAGVAVAGVAMLVL